MAVEIRALWLEYEEGGTIEADVAMQLDKFEMIVQANEYELSNPGKRLDRFFESTKDSFSHPEVLVTCNGNNCSTPCVAENGVLRYTRSSCKY